MKLIVCYIINTSTDLLLSSKGNSVGCIIPDIMGEIYNREIYMGETENTEKP